jgi:hypothetical protein
MGQQNSVPGNVERQVDKHHPTSRERISLSAGKAPGPENKPAPTPGKKTPPVQGKERKSTLYWQRWQKDRYNRFRQLSVLPMKR